MFHFPLRGSLIGVMKVINIQHAKTHLSNCVEEAVEGEEIVIAKAGKPLVRLVPFQEQAQPRILGVLAGQVRESPDCWSADSEDLLVV